MRRIFWLLAFFSSLGFADCPQLYPYGKTIEVKNTVELCNTSYVVRYAEDRKSAIFSAEILQPTGHQIVRKNDFHSDPRIKNKVYPHDYSNTGYDRGHLTPADDSTSDKEMKETFLMSNMVPQLPNVNRVIIKDLEDRTRKLVKGLGQPIHVLTGAIYSDDKKINGIPVPSQCYKIVFWPSGSKAFLTDNSLDATLKEVEISEIENKVGFKFQ